jgi:small-conductance mechanosensitive channel
MTYNNHANYQGNESPISREELNSMAAALESISVVMSDNNQPTMMALEKLSIEQEAQREEAAKNWGEMLQQISHLKKIVDLQSGEIATLKQQNRRLADWLLKHFQWKKIAGAAVFITVIAIATSAFLQNMALSNLGKAITEQQGAILGKVKEIDKKTKR